jgi:Tfp pilus assembly protein FimT
VTILELLMVLAGLLTLLVLMAEPFSGFLDSYRLNSAAQSLTSTLELARHTALARNCDTVVLFIPADRYYELFVDRNHDGIREPGEELLRGHHLAEGVAFDGTGLWGPPASPASPVAEGISFPSNRVTFNAQGKLSSGLGTVYLQNRRKEARALSYNLASRLKIYSWQKDSLSWQ